MTGADHHPIPGLSWATNGAVPTDMDEALRTGTCAKALTFTLSTTQP